MNSQKTKIANAAMALLLTGMLVAGFFDADYLIPPGIFCLGLVFLIFHGELAAERFRIDKSTPNVALRNLLFSAETKEKNSLVFMICGILLTIGGAFMCLAMLT
jgi:hypothetical protein